MTDSFTVERLRAAQDMMASLTAAQIVFTPHVPPYERERTFPVSKNRSPRNHKKLCRRHGGEYRTLFDRPTAWCVGGVYYCHLLHRDNVMRAIDNATPPPDRNAGQGGGREEGGNG